MDSPESPSFACGMCGKLFSEAEQLRLHIQMHTGQQPFRCVICWPLFYDMSNDAASQPCSSSQPAAPSRASASKRVEASVSSQEAVPSQVTAAIKDTPPVEVVASVSSATVKMSDVQITPSLKSSADDEPPVLVPQNVAAADLDVSVLKSPTEDKMSTRGSVMGKTQIASVTASSDKEVLMTDDEPPDLESEVDTNVIIKSDSSMLKTKAFVTMTATEYVVGKSESKTVMMSTDREVLMDVSQEETDAVQKELYENTLRTDSAADKELVRDAMAHKEDTVTNKEIELVKMQTEHVVADKVNLTDTTLKEDMVENELKERDLGTVLQKEDIVSSVQALSASVTASKETLLPFDQNDTGIETAPNIPVTRMKDEDMKGRVTQESVMVAVPNETGETQKNSDVNASSLNSSFATTVDVLSQVGAVCCSGSHSSYQNTTTVHSSTPHIGDSGTNCKNSEMMAESSTTDIFQNSTPITLNTKVSGDETPQIQRANLYAPVITDLSCIQFSLEELVSSADFSKQQQMTDPVGSEFKNSFPDQTFQNGDCSYGLHEASSSQNSLCSSVCIQSTPATAVPENFSPHSGRRRKTKPKKLACEGPYPPFVAERLRQEAAIRNDHIYSNPFREGKPESVDHERATLSLTDVSFHFEADDNELEVGYQEDNSRNCEDDSDSKDSGSSFKDKQQHVTPKTCPQKALPSEFHTGTTSQGLQQKADNSEENGSALDGARVKSTAVNFQGIISFLKNVHLKNPPDSKNSEGNSISRGDDKSGQPAEPVIETFTVTTPSPDGKSRVRCPKRSVIETFTVTIPSPDDESRHPKRPIIETFTVTTPLPDSTTSPFGSGNEEESRVLDTLDNSRRTNSENIPRQEQLSNMMIASTSRSGLAEDQEVIVQPESSKKEEETLCVTESSEGSKLESSESRGIAVSKQSICVNERLPKGVRLTAEVENNVSPIHSTEAKTKGGRLELLLNDASKSNSTFLKTNCREGNSVTPNTRNESTLQTETKICSTRATVRVEKLTQESIQQKAVQFEASRPHTGDLTRESVQQRTIQFVKDRTVSRPHAGDANMQSPSKGRAASSIMQTRSTTKRKSAKHVEETESKTNSTTKWQALMADVISPNPLISIPFADTNDSVNPVSTAEPLFVTENAAVSNLTSGVGCMPQNSTADQSAVVSVSSSDNTLASAVVITKTTSTDVSTSVVGSCAMFAKNEEVTQAETQSTVKTIPSTEASDRTSKISFELHSKRLIEVSGAAVSKSASENDSSICENVKMNKMLPESVSANPSVFIQRMSDSALQDLLLGKTVKASSIQSVQNNPFRMYAHVPYNYPVQLVNLDNSEDTDEDETRDQEASDSDRTLLYGDEESMSDCCCPPKHDTRSSPRKSTQQAEDTNLQRLCIPSHKRTAEQKHSHKIRNKNSVIAGSEKPIEILETEQRENQQCHQNVALHSQVNRGLSTEQNNVYEINMPSGLIKSPEMPGRWIPKHSKSSTISGVRSIIKENYIAPEDSHLSQIASEAENTKRRDLRKKAVQKCDEIDQQKQEGVRPCQPVGDQVEEGDWPLPKQITINTRLRTEKDNASVQHKNRQDGHSQKDSRIVPDKRQLTVQNKQKKLKDQHAQQGKQTVIAGASSSNSQRSYCSRKRISQTNKRQQMRRSQLPVEKQVVTYSEAFSDCQDAPTPVQRSSRNVSFDSPENARNTLSVSSDINIDDSSMEMGLDTRSSSLDNQSALFTVIDSDGKTLETPDLLAFDAAQQEVLDAVQQGNLMNQDASLSMFCTDCNGINRPLTPGRRVSEESLEFVNLPEISKPRRTRPKGKSSEYYWRSRHEKTRAIMTGNRLEEHSPAITALDTHLEECTESLPVSSSRRVELENGVNVVQSWSLSSQQDNFNLSSYGTLSAQQDDFNSSYAALSAQQDNFNLSYAVTLECDRYVIPKEETPMSGGNQQVEVVQETEESNFQMMKAEIVGNEILVQLRSPEMFTLSAAQLAASSEVPVQCTSPEVFTPTVTESTVDRERAVQNRSPEIFTPCVAESVKRAATRRKTALQPLTYTDKTSVKTDRGISDNVLSEISPDATNGLKLKARKVLKRKKDSPNKEREKQKPREKQKGSHPRESAPLRPDGNKLGEIIIMPCSLCGAKFKKHAKYVSHLRTGCKERFVCDICGKTYGRRETLKNHMADHTGKNAVTCNICGKRLCGRHSLVTHMRIHTDERPYKCPECPKTFRQPSALSSHYRTHTQDRPYTCDICGKSYRFHKNLSSHRLTHTGERPYVCPVCTASFFQVSSLTVHLRKHSNERPVACDYCVMRFAQKQHLLKHISHVHSHKIRELEYRKAKDEGKPHLCALCNRGFNSVYSMRRHMKSFCFLLDKSSDKQKIGDV